MSDGELGVVLVGCGVIGRVHRDAIDRTDGVRVAALVDPVLERAQALAGPSSAPGGSGLEAPPRVFADLADALDAVPSDVVAVATPSGLHTGVAAEALAAGRHVVIEKPLDVSVAAGRRFADLADRSGRMVSVISQHRFDPATVAVTRAADAGRMGRLTSANASVPWWRAQSYYDSGDWRGTWALDGGGAAMNQGVHTVDLVVRLLGDPVEVSGETALLAHERVEVEDVAVAWLRFASGALAVLHATTAANPGTGVRIALYGSAGSAVIEDDELRSLVTVDGDATPAAGSAGPTVGAEPVPADFVAGHARQWTDVVAALRDGRPPAVGVRDALTTLAVVRGIYLSAERGERVRVADVLSGALDDEGVGR